MVMDLKKECDELLGVRKGRLSLPQLTLFEKKIPPIQEELLIKELEKAISATRTFDMQFGFIRALNTKTLWIELIEDGGFSRLIFNMRALLRVPKIDRPHLSIARELTEAELSTAIEHFSNRILEHTFTVARLLLLKSPTGRDYEKVAEFGLK